MARKIFEPEVEFRSFVKAVSLQELFLNSFTFLSYSKSLFAEHLLYLLYFVIFIIFVMISIFFLYTMLVVVVVKGGVFIYFVIDVQKIKIQ
jgi:hypothetical protein